MNDVEIKDVDKLKNLLIEFGLYYTEDSHEGGYSWIMLENDAYKYHPKIGGYAGCYANFQFNQDGTFVQVDLGE